jgi:hypothetical protein
MSANPYKPARAKQLIRDILANGVVSFSKHAMVELKNDKLETTDCVNVLRGGVVEPPELINGTWRYRVVTRLICVVISFPDEDEVRVVTAWRTL